MLWHYQRRKYEEATQVMNFGGFFLANTPKLCEWLLIITNVAHLCSEVPWHAN